jgi:hypothetical protein
MSYIPPSFDPVPETQPDPDRGKLREVALRQRAVTSCLLVYLIVGVARISLLPNPGNPPNPKDGPGPIILILIVGLLTLAVIITTAVMVFRLAITIYGTGTGVLMGILTLIPILGLVSLLIVNGKATGILRSHGIKVGFMGAARAQIPPE